MMWFELQDMLFLIKNIKYPSDNYNILDFVSFVKSSTRFGSSTKLKLNRCRTNTTRHFYFNRIARLWNSFPEIDLSLSVRTIKSRLYNHLWNYFTAKFDSHSFCTFHFSCPHCKLYNGLWFSFTFCCLLFFVVAFLCLCKLFYGLMIFVICFLS